MTKIVALAVLSGIAAGVLTAETVYDVTTFAGVLPGSQDGRGREARFSQLQGIAVDAGGAVYAADFGNHTVRRISPDGTVTTVLGTARQSGPPISRDLLLSYPQMVAVDAQGRLYVGDGSNLLKFEPDRTYATVASTSLFFFDAAVTGDGTVFATNWYQNQVWKYPAGGGAVRIAGSPTGEKGNAEGAGDAARFNFPEGIAVGENGTIYVADSGNFAIRAIDGSGNVSTFAGAAGVSGFADGVGAAARFGFPEIIDLDLAGNLYVADAVTVRKVTPQRNVTTLAGVADEQGTVDGVGSAARF